MTFQILMMIIKSAGNWINMLIGKDTIQYDSYNNNITGIYQ